MEFVMVLRLHPVVLKIVQNLKELLSPVRKKTLSGYCDQAMEGDYMFWSFIPRLGKGNNYIL
jgi:hypothetical protein